MLEEKGRELYQKPDESCAFNLVLSLWLPEQTVKYNRMHNLIIIHGQTFCPGTKFQNGFLGPDMEAVA